MKRTAGAIFALAVLLLGCPSPQKKMQDSKNELIEAAEAYNELYAWRNFDEAAQYVVRDNRAAYRAEMEPLKRTMTIDESKIIDIQLGPDGVTGSVEVQRKYAIAPDVTLQNEIITQRWVRVEGAWYLAGPPY